MLVTCSRKSKISAVRMTKGLTVVVTGSNRGIGRAITEKLAATKHQPHLEIYATSRSGQSLPIKPQHENEVHYMKLDISDKSSVSAFLQQPAIQDISIDVLINNAGVNFDYDNDNRNRVERATDTMRINYAGTKQVCLSFLDPKGGRMTLNHGSRIVNVSSAAAGLHGYSKEIQERFRGVRTLADVDALAKDYLEAISVSPSEADRRGWRLPTYSVSKALINALTLVLAQLPNNADILINSCDPGWVASDMGSLVGSPPKSLEEGARIPVKLALADLQGTSGKFWGNRDVSNPADGDILPW